MIRNERQHRITKAQAEKLAEALKQLRQEVEETENPGRLKQAEEDALRSQLEDLERELQEYERLRSGRNAAIEAKSFEELPDALIRARIAAGMRAAG